uniref:Uncharacterized protein n=1 Tax=Oryzias sinensis TaxID=183150 RepID=A0A8C7YDJ7_9TELE
MQGGWRACGPRLWLRHVDKRVKVKTRRQEHRGWLLSVDPVSIHGKVEPELDAFLHTVR